MSTAILFATDALDVFVVDIPRSLELANGGGRTYSSKPPTVPYVTPEPKGKKREDFIAKLPAEHLAYHEDVQNGISIALQSIAESFSDFDWCFDRIQDEAVEIWDLYLPQTNEVDQPTLLPLILSTLRNICPSLQSLSTDVVLNPSSVATCIQVSGHGLIRVPADCAFFWSKIDRAPDVLHSYSPTSATCFDLILMDPPWTNRSVRNSHKYSTVERQSSDPFEHAVTIVKRHLKTKGCVAVWITNKDAVRQKVLSTMASLGLCLVEEWIWVKLTCQGEPVTPLDGVWRRPYEPLLIFRNQQNLNPPSHRYIFAVPDIHSRKPNLKELFSKLFQPSSVLELFARNLTSGWWSIGDEVPKFQHQSAWSSWPE